MAVYSSRCPLFVVCPGSHALRGNPRADAPRRMGRWFGLDVSLLWSPRRRRASVSAFPRRAWERGNSIGNDERRVRVNGRTIYFLNAVAVQGWKSLRGWPVATCPLRERIKDKSADWRFVIGRRRWTVVSCQLSVAGNLLSSCGWPPASETRRSTMPICFRCLNTATRNRAWSSNVKLNLVPSLS